MHAFQGKKNAKYPLKVGVALIALISSLNILFPYCNAWALSAPSEEKVAAEEVLKADEQNLLLSAVPSPSPSSPALPSKTKKYLPPPLPTEKGGNEKGDKKEENLQLSAQEQELVIGVAPESREGKKELLNKEGDMPSASHASDSSRADVPMKPFSLKEVLGQQDDLSLPDHASGAEAVSAVKVLQSISMNEAVVLALRNNYEVLAARQKTHGSFWEKMQAYFRYLPNIEATFATSSERSRPGSYNDTNGDRVRDTTHNRRDRQVTVRQPLVDLTLIADAMAAVDREDISNLEYMDIQETIAAETVTAYLKLLQARVSMQLAEDYKAYLQDLQGRMQARVEGGGATGADLDRIVSRAALAESARVEAAGEYQAVLADFMRLTRVDPSRLRLPESLVPVVPEKIDEVLAQAAKTNPSYQAERIKVELARTNRDKSYSQLAPKILAQYSGSYVYNAGGAAAANPVDGVYPSQRTDSVMLVARWAMNGGAEVAGGLAAQSQVRELHLRAMDVQARLEQGIRSAYIAIQAAGQREEVLTRAMRTNERVITGFEDQYKEGNRPVFDLLDAYEQLYNARLNLMRVVFAKAQASYQIHKLMGKLVATLAQEGRE